MALIIRGRRKGEPVQVADVKGEFATLHDGTTMRLGMLEVDDDEQRIIKLRFASSPTFKIYYDFDHFIKSRRFKKVHWARV